MVKKKGYTLIELLIFMGMFSILLVVFTNIFSVIMDVRRESESVSSVEQDGNYIFNRLIYDISRATVINQPSSDGVTDTVLDLIIDGTNYLYGLSGQNLTLTFNSQPLQLNSINTTVSGLTFTRIGNDDDKDTIKLNFTVSSPGPSGPETSTYQTTVGLR